MKLKQNNYVELVLDNPTTCLLYEVNNLNKAFHFQEENNKLKRKTHILDFIKNYILL